MQAFGPAPSCFKGKPVCQALFLLSFILPDNIWDDLFSYLPLPSGKILSVFFSYFNHDDKATLLIFDVMTPLCL